MLRPPRRHSRTLLTVLVLIATLGLIWPAGIAAVSRSAPSGGSSAPDARPERAPTVRGEGVKSLDSGRGHGPSKPLQKLKIDRAARKDSGSSTGGTRAPSFTPAAPVNAGSSGAPAATSHDPWDGLAQQIPADPAVPPIEPPDPWVAVGPDDVVQTVNTRIRFRTREGVETSPDLQLFEFFDLADFEACPPQALPGCTAVPMAIDGIGDPRWLFDNRHNRWVGMTMGWHCPDATVNDPIGFVFGAISRTGDPTGDYYQFYVQYEGFLPDYPMIGTSADKITISANEYTLLDQADCTDGLVIDADFAATLTTFDWAEMLGSPALPDFTYNFFDNLYALRPAVAPQSVSNTMFVVGEEMGGTNSHVAYLRLTGTNASAGVVLSGPVDLTTAGIIDPFVDPPTPAQPGGGLPASIVDRRPTDAIWQDNILTFVSTAPCDPAGGPAETRACARVAQLKTSTATPSLFQDFVVGTTGMDTWYPGVGVSGSGILHVVYTESSSSQGMSSFDRYQLPDDPPNSLSAPRLLADGGATHYGGGATTGQWGDRWGDYVGVAQDPRDTNAVWQGNQYTKSNNTWGTRVSELQTPGSTFVPIPPLRVLDSRTNVGTTGAFTNGVPKTVDIVGLPEIPPGAVAITGNLTVVGQQQAGFVSVTPLPTASPTNSSINFPAGDVRANNITSPLSNAGGVSLTYKSATAGKKTHLVLDVTGYFLNDPTGGTYKILSPLRVLDTRIDLGLTNRFQANENRTFQVAGVGTIPDGATAITGNLTVVDQTAAGYVTLATEPPPALPATSTINFPLGDVRANGVTILLSDTGTLSAVYKAVSGSTHLILDVTGYYVDDLTGARFIALTPGRRMDTRLPAPREGLAGPFIANSARTLIIEPYQGVPTNAVAITGNLTVVGQTRAGYVSMTDVAVNPPPNSTLNFPLGDIRANGVTGPLSPGGSVGLIYKATSGATHLILDLTGYFR